MNTAQRNCIASLCSLQSATNEQIAIDCGYSVKTVQITMKNLNKADYVHQSGWNDRTGTPAIIWSVGKQTKEIPPRPNKAGKTYKAEQVRYTTYIRHPRDSVLDALMGVSHVRT